MYDLIPCDSSTTLPPVWNPAHTTSDDTGNVKPIAWNSRGYTETLSTQANKMKELWIGTATGSAGHVAASKSSRRNGSDPGSINNQETRDISCTKKDPFLFGVEANEEMIYVPQVYENYK